MSFYLLQKNLNLKKGKFKLLSGKFRPVIFFRKLCSLETKFAKKIWKRRMNKVGKRKPEQIYWLRSFMRQNCWQTFIKFLHFRKNGKMMQRSSKWIVLNSFSKFVLHTCSNKLFKQKFVQCCVICTKIYKHKASNLQMALTNRPKKSHYLLF